MPSFRFSSTLRTQFIAFWCQMHAGPAVAMDPPEPLRIFQHTRMYRSDCQIIKELGPLGINPVQLQPYLTHRLDLRPFKLTATDMWGNKYLGPELKIMQWMAEPPTQPLAGRV